MEVKLVYCKEQLEAAVKFIARNNAYFLGQTDYIKTAIMLRMRDVALNPDRDMVGTMGFEVHVEYRVWEGIDSDRNCCYVRILVDPSVGNYSTEDVSEILNG